jgi:D-sedoheptulose 7-phosphate isomerase
MTFCEDYISETVQLLQYIDCIQLEKIVFHLKSIRDIGRLFVLGVGGSAGTATHAVNDFRKICNFNTQSITDNVCELTARINDEGWENCFLNWLKCSNLNSNDALLVFSVGGGDKVKNISMNIVNALNYAHDVKAIILGVVGKEGGYTKEIADACVIIPPIFPDRITPHTEGLAGVILHLIVSHPSLKIAQTKWESVK